MSLTSDELRSTLSELALYSLSLENTEEGWESTKALFYEMLQMEPDTIFHLVQVAVRRLQRIAYRSRSIIEDAVAATAALKIEPQLYDAAALNDNKNQIGALGRMALSSNVDSRVERVQTAAKKQVRGHIARGNVSTYGNKDEATVTLTSI